MTPKGFWSYAQGDDKHLDGILSDLRGKVAGEVSMLLGHDIGIFQDISDLHAGDRWEERLRQEVTAATFLMPVLTPRYFNRPFCREETLTFLRVAREQGVEPRIFPIRFVQYDAEEGDEVRAALAEFQYKDFSTWRFDSSTRRKRLLNEFALDVKARLLEKPGVLDVGPPSQAEASVATAPSEVSMQPRKRGARESPTVSVDPMPGRGDFLTIAAAIDAVPAGARIVIRPGTYREAVRLSKPLELVGDGDRDEIVLATAESDVLSCEVPIARLRGITIRQEDRGEELSGIKISGGSLSVDDCVIESSSGACVSIEGDAATPTLRRCTIVNSAQVGLYIFGGARALLEDCVIESWSGTGVAIYGRGTGSILRRCSMTGLASEGGGLSIAAGAQPMLEDCVVACSGLAIAVRGEGTNPILRRSSARAEWGYSFVAGARGLLDRCEAIGSTDAGIVISGGSNPLITECVVRENHNSGVLIAEGGLGRLERCAIENNGGVGVFVQDGGAPVVRGCSIRRNGLSAVAIVDAESGGTFENNDLRENARGAWRVAEVAGDRLVRRSNQEE